MSLFLPITCLLQLLIFFKELFYRLTTVIVINTKSHLILYFNIIFIDWKESIEKHQQFSINEFCVELNFKILLCQIFQKFFILPILKKLITKFVFVPEFNFVCNLLFEFLIYGLKMVETLQDHKEVVQLLHKLLFMITWLYTHDFQIHFDKCSKNNGNNCNAEEYHYHTQQSFIICLWKKVAKSDNWNRCHAKVEWLEDALPKG